MATTALNSVSHRSARSVLVRALLAAGITTLAGCGGGGTGGSDAAALGTATPVATTPVAATPVAATPAPALDVDTSEAAKSGARTLSAVKFRASAVLHQGVGAAVAVRYNGVQIAAFEVKKPEATEYSVSTSTEINGGVVEIVVTNASDAQGKPLRHLKVDTVTVGETIYQATDGRVVFDRGDGPAAFDGQDVRPVRAALTRNGALRLTLPTTQQLNAAKEALASSRPAGYYVDADTGADTNPGTIDRPWRTLAKLQHTQLKAGEGFHLRCGRVWRESLKLNALQLVDGSIIDGYGSECALRKAVISGADDFSTGWQRGGNVWSRAVPAGTPKITQLFVDGQAMRTAQWPDPGAAGHVHAIAGPGPASTTEVTLQPADAAALAGRELVGARVHIRTQPWMIETRRIASAGANTFRLDAATESAIQPGEGIVLQDKLWMLDAPGEFFHDPVGQRLYMIAPTTGVPADINVARVEGSVRDIALSLSQRNALVVRDLALQGARQDGLRLEDVPGIQVSRIEVLDNEVNGIALAQWTSVASNAAGASVTDSLFAGNGQYGLNAYYVTGALIKGNRVLANGTGDHHQGNVMAGISAGPSGRIEDNTVDGAGYIGIRFSALGSNVVARNTVTNYCTRLSDCAGIYTWQGRGNAAAAQSATINSNRVLAASPFMAGTVADGSDLVAGIYLDDFSRNVTISDNLVAGMPIGIFLHNSSQSAVRNNRIWMATRIALAASMDQTDGDWMTGNAWHDNLIVPVVEAQAAAGGVPSIKTSQAVSFGHALSGTAALAPGRNHFSGNRVMQLQGSLKIHAWIDGPAAGRFIDAFEWQQLNPNEPLPFRPARFDAVAAQMGPELAIGGGFDSGIGNWGKYNHPDGGGFALTPLASASGCSGPCVSLTVGHPWDFLGSSAFAVRAGVPYVFRWSAVMPQSASATVGEPYISRSASPWDAMADARGFVEYRSRRGTNGEKLSYEAYFVAKESTSVQAFLQLSTVRVPVAIDDVSVREVTGYSVATAADWATLAVAPADASRTVGCAELGWPANCSAIDTDANPVALPFVLAAGTDKMVLRADSTFRR